MRRMLLALAVLVLLAAGAGALVAFREPGAGATDAFPVEVLGPEGPLFAGAVRVENATALAVLLATGLDVDVVEYRGMGAYVRAIDGHAAAGPDGWVYEVRRDGAWTNGDRSAALFPLHAGDEVRWSWTSR